MKANLSLLMIIISVMIIHIRSNIASHPFRESPDFRLAQLTQGCVVKISPQEKNVAVGFKNGSIVVYDMELGKQFQCNNHTDKIIEIQYLEEGSFISLDEGGKAVKWQGRGSSATVWQLKKPALGMSVSKGKTRNQTFVGFNFGDQIIQHFSDSQVVNKVYWPQPGSRFTSLQYSTTYTQLYVSTNRSQVQAYWCKNASLINYKPLTTLLPIKRLRLSSNNQLAALTQWVNVTFLYRIEANLSSLFYKLTDHYTEMIVHYHNGEEFFAMADTSNNTLNRSLGVDLYDTPMNFVQSLYYVQTGSTSKYLKAMDSSENYIVLLYDSDLYLGSASPPDNDQDDTWLIVLIVLGGLIVVAGIFVFVKKCMEKRRVKKINDYDKVEGV